MDFCIGLHYNTVIRRGGWGEREREKEEKKEKTESRGKGVVSEQP